MATKDKCCSVAPYFKVKKGKMKAFKGVCARLLAKASKDPGCLYYGFAFDGDTAFCREAYKDANAFLAHLKDIGPLIDESARYSEIERFEIHGTKSELAKVRKGLGKMKARYFVLECGVRK